jgi:predicted DsbA family dithiol-disulfide isomerase
VLAELWQEVGLDPARFDEHRRPELLDEVMDDHNAALDAGVTGVPAAQLAGNDAVIVGAHPAALYKTWIERMLARRRAGESLA